ncbi:MAG: cob(I)yrinic acid a,c-diamide adenosyltransferase, partial [Pseudomonadota bacterium]|nr:cob(I)yrinic acid a,c-diamide adenosyltransferase [Pseudomonadota bacterium]
MSKSEEELKQERHKKKAQKQKEKVDASIAKAT